MEALIAAYGAGSEHEGEGDNSSNEAASDVPTTHQQRQQQHTGTETAHTGITVHTASVAPAVSTVGMAAGSQSSENHKSVVTAHSLHDPTKHIVFHNPTADALGAPIAGPRHPYGTDIVSAGEKNHPTGNVEDAHVGDIAFAQQFHRFNATGAAEEPGGYGTVLNHRSFDQRDGGGPSAADLVRGVVERKRKRQEGSGNTTADEEAVLSSVADATAPDAQQSTQQQGSVWDEGEELAPKPLRDHAMLSDKQKDFINWWQQRYNAKRDKSKRLEAEAEEEHKADAPPQDAAVSGPSDNAPTDTISTFYGESEVQYDGRSWIDAPKDKRRVETERCFVPKELEMELSSHSKGVSAIRMMPPYGNLLLSSSYDSEIRIWDIANRTGKCMRTYLGHTKGVRDISFSHDGKKFASCGYDQKVRLWDTESGHCLNSFTASSVPKCVRVHPDEDKSTVVMAGLEDARVVQYDMNTGDHMQDYKWHTKAINSITFVDENRRFVTTSDDRTMRAWEYGIPVQIKYVAEPSMHAMPSVAVHPNGKFMSAQSLDNRLVTYATSERFRFNGKKTFTGHVNGGFPCQVCFSRDGRYIASGDSSGNVFFWSWSNTKLFRKIKCHSKATIGCEWHPLHPSRVATCSWSDGNIKLWI